MVGSEGEEVGEISSEEVGVTSWEGEARASCLTELRPVLRHLELLPLHQQPGRLYLL